MFFHHPLSKVIFKLSSDSCGYHAAILRLSPGYLRISCRFITTILRLSPGYPPAILGYLVDLLRLSPAISRLYLAAIFDFRGYRAAISRLSPGYLRLSGHIFVNFANIGSNVQRLLVFGFTYLFVLRTWLSSQRHRW